MSNGLYDALRDAGLDLLRAHRLDVYLRTVGDDEASDRLRPLAARRPRRPDRLRATLLADLDAITTGLALLDR